MTRMDAGRFTRALHGALLLLLVAAAPAGAADRTVSSGPTDSGYGSGRAWVDVDGDRRADYCRVVGSGPFAGHCTLATGEGFGADRFKGDFTDRGYENDRAWVDVDGDRHADYCRFVGAADSNEQIRCTAWAEGGEGRSTAARWGDAAGRAWVDASGDGLADFCRVVGAGASWQVACTLATPAGWGGTVTSAALDPGAPSGRAWVDADADGRVDFCRVIGNTVSCARGATDWATSVASGPLDVGYDDGRTWVDVDNDRRADFCRHTGAPGTSEQLACTTSPAGPFSATDNSNGHVGWGHTRAWADFDADGRLDFCRLTGADATNQKAGCVRLDPGGGTAPFGTSEPLVAGQDTGRAWVDHDADGRADFCRLVSSGHDSRLTCTLSNGRDFVTPPSPARAETPVVPGPGGGASEVAAPSPPPKVDATVRTFWRVGRARTRLVSLKLSGLPGNGTVTVLCRARLRRDCPFRSRAYTGAQARRELAKPFRRGLRPASTLEVRVTVPGAIGKVVRYTVRRRALPRRIVLCLPEGGRAGRC